MVLHYYTLDYHMHPDDMVVSGWMIGWTY